MTIDEIRGIEMNAVARQVFGSRLRAANHTPGGFEVAVRGDVLLPELECLSVLAGTKMIRIAGSSGFLNDRLDEDDMYVDTTITISWE